MIRLRDKSSSDGGGGGLMRGIKQQKFALKMQGGGGGGGVFAGHYGIFIVTPTFSNLSAPFALYNQTYLLTYKQLKSSIGAAVTMIIKHSLMNLIWFVLIVIHKSRMALWFFLFCVTIIVW